MKGDAMTEEQQQWIELGRRAVACAGWRWVPGMRVFRVMVCQDTPIMGWDPDLPEMWIMHIPPMPDVDNPDDRGGHCIAQIHGKKWWDCCEGGQVGQMYFWDPDRRQGEGAFTPDLEPRERKSIRELMDHSEVVPDLRDPATRGCVMALVDELRLGVDTRTAADEVRAGALVAALEVAS